MMHGRVFDDYLFMPGSFSAVVTEGEQHLAGHKKRATAIKVKNANIKFIPIRIYNTCDIVMSFRDAILKNLISENPMYARFN